MSQVSLNTNNRQLPNIVTQLVAETMQKKPAQILPDEPLFASQARFDSFALLELVMRLEERFGLTIPDADLDPDIFYSIETIVSYVKVRLDQAV